MARRSRCAIRSSNCCGRWPNTKALVLSREQLLEQVWCYDYFGETRTVDVHVKQVRRKLGESAVSIQTVRGVGYKLVYATASDT